MLCNEVSKFRSKVAVKDFQDCDASGVAKNFKRRGHNFNIFSSVVFFGRANLKQIKKQKRLWGEGGPGAYFPENI